MEIITEKENFDQKMHLEIKSPVKKDGDKVNVMNVIGNTKKPASDTSLFIMNKNPNENSDFHIKKIFWDYKKMLGNLKFCNVPRFLIVEVN
mgnify:CR=1 FL=1